MEINTFYSSLPAHPSIPPALAAEGEDIAAAEQENSTQQRPDLPSTEL